MNAQLLRLSQVFLSFALLGGLSLGCKKRAYNENATSKSASVSTLDSDGCLQPRPRRPIDRSPPLEFGECDGAKFTLLTSEGSFNGIQVDGQTLVTWEGPYSYSSGGKKMAASGKFEGDRLVSADIGLHLFIGDSADDGKVCLGRVQIKNNRFDDSVPLPQRAPAGMEDGSIVFLTQKTLDDPSPATLAKFTNCKFNKNIRYLKDFLE
jgi:hypothetical protein